MPFGEAGDANAKTSGIRVDPAHIELLDECHKVGGMLEGVVFTPVVLQVLWRITAQRQDVAHTRFCIPLQDGLDIGLRVADTGEVGHGVDTGVLLDPDHEIVGHLPGGSTCAIGNADEIWLVASQLLHRFEQRL